MRIISVIWEPHEGQAAAAMSASGYHERPPRPKGVKQLRPSEDVSIEATA
jgi:hypothetical protein